MRLINAKTYDLEDFSLKAIPEYAILSHTWGDDEVTYHDMSSPDRSVRQGWYKVAQTCRIAQDHQLDYVWVDTCCIDKSSSAELTEAINSMFQWYRKAYKCIVMLSDLVPSIEDEVKRALPACRWWSRGWTLQELIAPRRLNFYIASGTHVGSRESLSEAINKCTNIPSRVLGSRSALMTMSVAARMSWAAARETTRVEDMAYCLLGILGVNMPLIYGEGDRAFRRLQEEVVRRESDLTIFACEPKHGLFADSARAFRNQENFERYPNSFLDFSVTNRGLRLSGQTPLRLCRINGNPRTPPWTLVLFLGHFGDLTTSSGICLRKVGPKLFRKDPEFSMVFFQGSEIGRRRLFYATDIYVIIDWDESKNLLSKSFRTRAIHVPETDIFSLQDAIPETLWDPSDRMLLKPQPYKWSRYQIVLAMRFTAAIPDTPELVVLCDAREYPPKAVLCVSQDQCRIEDLLFRGSRREDSMPWFDLELHAPSIRELSDTIKVDTDSKSYTISVSLRQQRLEPGSPLDVVLEVVEQPQ